MTTAKDSPRAADFMRKRVHTVTPDMTLKEIICFLLKHKISNAPVVEPTQGRNHLVGFVSERDCLATLSNESFFGTPAPPQTARTMMRRHPVCVSPDTELFTLASVFVNHGYRHVPVTDGKTLVGIVSRRDILRALNDYYGERVAGDMHRRSHPDLTQLIHHRFLVSD